MTEKQIIERLMLKSLETRNAQRHYFKNRNPVNKRLAIAKEQDLDNYLVELKKKGFNPESQIDQTSQPKMF